MKTTYRSSAALTLLIVLALLVSACATPPPPYRSAPSVTPQFANLVTPDMRIVATDGSWVMEPGEPFVPPTYVDTDWDNREKSANTGVWATAFNPSSYLTLSQRLQNEMLDVRVELQDGSTLNGKLLFFNVRRNTDDSSALRMWTVAVPDQYIDIAQAGNVAVIYQPYRQRNQDRDIVSWVMWISSLPL